MTTNVKGDLILFLGSAMFYQASMNEALTNHALPNERKIEVIALLVEILRRLSPPDMAVDVHRQLIGAGEEVVRVLTSPTTHFRETVQSGADQSETALIMLVSIRKILEMIWEGKGR